MSVHVGVVEKGKKYGQKLGFPTANIGLQEPVEGGIYAARAWVSNTEYAAAVFVDAKRNVLEAYLLDFTGDIYGGELRVELLKKLRESKQFDDEDELKRAIEDDVAQVRDIFGKL